MGPLSVIACVLIVGVGAAPIDGASNEDQRALEASDDLPDAHKLNSNEILWGVPSIVNSIPKIISHIPVPSIPTPPLPTPDSVIKGMLQTLMSRVPDSVDLPSFRHSGMRHPILHAHCLVR